MFISWTSLLNLCIFCHDLTQSCWTCNYCWWVSVNWVLEKSIKKSSIFLNFDVWSRKKSEFRVVSIGIGVFESILGLGETTLHEGTGDVWGRQTLMTTIPILIILCNNQLSALTSSSQIFKFSLIISKPIFFQ